MQEYKCLVQQQFKNGEFELIPIRQEDRFLIMKWRNEQIYHLRQNEILTEEKQTAYFDNVVSKLFDIEKPNQILFSFLKNNELIGYGGLVHINWIDKNAEISFLMNTELEKENFNHYWFEYLKLLDKIAFEELEFHKMYTYAFDLRPKLYEVLEQSGYKKEAVLSEQCFFQGKYLDVVIHSKFGYELKRATPTDLKITYDWAINSDVRRYSFNQTKIDWDTHEKWFLSKLKDVKSLYLLLYLNKLIMGSFRLDINNKEGLISFLTDPQHHGKGIGKKIIKLGIRYIQDEIKDVKLIRAMVMKDNIASCKIFESFNFDKFQEVNTIEYTLRINDEF